MMEESLFITNRRDVHIDSVQAHLQQMGFCSSRLNTENLYKKINYSLNLEEKYRSRYVDIGTNKIDLEKISLGWRRKPYPIIDTIKDISDPNIKQLVSDEIEAFLDYLYTYEGIYWINNHIFTPSAHLKYNQLVKAKEVGLKVPQTLISNDPVDVKRFAAANNYNIIIKTLRSQAYGEEGKRKVLNTSRLSKKQLLKNLKLIEVNPVIYQECIDKEDDVRIVVVKNKTLAFLQKSPDSREIDYRAYAPNEIKTEVLELPKGVHTKCIQLVRDFGLDIGVIDMVRTKKKEYIFMENNPNGQWYWLEEETGVEISKEIALMITKMLKKKSNQIN